MRNYQIISADSHVVEPPDLWEKWLERKNTDKDAHLAGIRAYNRWLKEGFSAADPERLIAIFQTPNVGIETSVKELQRAKKEGYRGVAISAWPAGGDNLSRADDPFWDAA